MPCRQATAFFSQRTKGAALSAITLSLTMPVIGHPSKPSFSDARIASRLTATGFPYSKRRIHLQRAASDDTRGSRLQSSFELQSLFLKLGHKT